MVTNLNSRTQFGSVIAKNKIKPKKSGSKTGNPGPGDLSSTRIRNPAWIQGMKG